MVSQRDENDDGYVAGGAVSEQCGTMREWASGDERASEGEGVRVGRLPKSSRELRCLPSATRRTWSVR